MTGAITMMAVLDDADVWYSSGWLFTHFKDIEMGLRKVGATWKKSATIYQVLPNDKLQMICGQVL